MEGEKATVRNEEGSLVENTVDLAHPWCLGKMWTSGPALPPRAFLPVSRGMRIPELFKLLTGSCGAGR